MSGDVTYQALKRLTWLPRRDASKNGDVIAGQDYDDVLFIGGSISNVILTNVTVNGISTSPTLRIVTATGAVTVAPSDYTLVINKTTPAATVINLPASPATNRRLQVKDGAGNAGTYPITIQPAAGTIDGQTSFIMATNWMSLDFVYSGMQWLILG